MMLNDLGERMKCYEAVPQTKLMRRTPVAIRIDGRHFHSFCKGLQKPFDNIIVESMTGTLKALCEETQNCVFGYAQFDEITLILKDYETLDTQPWFDNKVQKICSITASMATLYFNQIFQERAEEYYFNELSDMSADYVHALYRCLETGAMFDARCFNIPKEEVTNLIYWRQLDAMRNSVFSFGRANLSHKEIQDLSCADIKSILAKRGEVWENLPIALQRGICCYKAEGKWRIDLTMPILKGEARDLVEKLID